MSDYRSARSTHILTSHLAGGANHGTRLLTSANGDSLAQNVPLLYDANGNVVSTATRTGNTTEFATSTGSKTANVPHIWDANGNIVVGTRTGNTTLFVTHDAGSKTSGNVPQYDADGNLTDSGSTPGGGGGTSVFRSSFATRPTTGISTGDLWFNDDRGSQLHSVAIASNTWTDYWGNRPVELPPSSGWTWDNQESGDTVDFTIGTMQFIAVRTAVGEHTLQYRTAPTAPYTIDFLFYHDFSGTNSTVNQGGRDANVGVYFRDSSGKFIYFGIGSFSNNHGTRVEYWNGDNSFNSTRIENFDNSGGAGYDATLQNPKALRIQDDNTNLKFYFALTEGSWVQFGGNLSRTAFLTSGPTEYGVGGYKGDGTIMMNIISIVEG